MLKIYEKYEKLFLLIFFLTPYFLLFSFWDGLYRDSDNYTHAIRVLDFLQSGTWAEQPFIHSNYPKGEILNFTRIIDVIWVFFALPFLPFFSLKDSVFYAGLLMQPSLAVLTAWAVNAQLKPYFGTYARLSAVIFFFFLPAVIQIYMFARPDHHTVIVFLGCCQTACFLKYLKQKDMFYMKTAGLIGAMLLWVSIEGILFSYFLASAWTVLWIAGKEDLKSVKIFMLYAFIFSFLFLLLNPPYEGLFFLDNGRLSILPVTVFGFSALAFFITDGGYLRSMTRTPAMRFVCLLILTAIFALLLLLVFGGVERVLAPYFPEEIKNRWAVCIGEFLPASFSKVAFASFAVPSIFALCFGLCAFKSSSADERKALILTLIPLLFFFLLTLKHIRFSENTAVFSVFPVVLFWRNFFKEDAPKTPCISGLILCFLYLFGVFYLSFCMLQIQEGYSHYKFSVYGFERIVPYLSAKGREGSILLFDSQGPEAIWATERPVIGTPNHRNIEGIVDTHTMLYGQSSDEVIKLLKKHSVTDVLITDQQVTDGVLFRLKCVKKIEDTPRPLILYHVNVSDCGQPERGERF